MLRVDARIRKGKTTSGSRLGLACPQMNAKPADISAKPLREAGISIGNRIKSVILKIVNWTEMIFFRKYVMAVRSLSSPAADLLRLDAAMRRDQARRRLDTSETRSKQPRTSAKPDSSAGAVPHGSVKSGD
jgi:hypothetical protein